MIVAPRSISARLLFRAAGFIATSTFGASPGVRMSREAKWIWNAETPASVPAGARISAGKFGSVARSLPSTAVASVKRLPASCMPSPESPAKRTTTRSRSSIVLLMASRPFVCASPAYEVYAGRVGARRKRRAPRRHPRVGALRLSPFYSFTTLIALGPLGPSSSSNETLLPSASER